MHDNILDLLLTNFEDLVQCISVDSHSSFFSSDHHSITFKIDLTKTPTYSILILVFAFIHIMLNSYTYIEEVITTAVRLFIPCTKFHSHQHPLWFTSDIRHHIKFQF